MPRLLLPAMRPATALGREPLAPALGRSVSLAGSDFHYAVLFAAPGRRAPLRALYGLWREIAEITDECRDPAVAAHKLGWWQEELDCFFAGRARHPAAIALHRLVRDDELAREPLERLVEAVARSFVQAGFADLAELLEHGRRREGALYALAAPILGVRRVDLADLGAGLRLAQLIGGLGAEVRRGRLDLPREELKRDGIPEADLLERRGSPGLTDLLARLHAHAAPLLAPPPGLPPTDQARLAPLFAPAAIARATLAEIAREGYPVLDHAIALTPLRKLWIAWRSARVAARHV